MNNLRTFYRILSQFNYDTIFFDAKTGKNIEFKKIFPTGSYSIIGNSSSILNNKNGKIIDSYNNVVRFNNYKIDKYKIYVGEKTDIWITGAGVQASSNIENKNATKIMITPKNISFQQKKNQFYNKYKDDNFFIFHNNFVMKLITSLVNGTPTTGMIIILLLSAKYNYIDTYGFSFGKVNNKYHYYNDNIIMDNGHKWNTEKKYYNLLSKQKIINKTKKNYNISSDTNNKLKELKKLFISF
jgi:hypothetical protein